MPRPKADLDAITVPKSAENAATAAGPEPASPKSYAHTLSLRLTAEGYRKLRRYVAEQEEKTGRRITHQSLIETMLLGFLDEKSKQ